MTIENIIASYSDTQKIILEFAKEAHGDQKRKYTWEPYWHHLVKVSGMVKDDWFTRESAILHDILEDTEIVEDSLCSFLIMHTDNASGIVEIVEKMTERKKKGRMKSKFAYIDQFPTSYSHLGLEVCKLKIADLIDNSKSIKEHARVARNKSGALRLSASGRPGTLGHWGMRCSTMLVEHLGAEQRPSAGQRDPWCQLRK